MGLRTGLEEPPSHFVCICIIRIGILTYRILASLQGDRQTFNEVLAVWEG